MLRLVYYRNAQVKVDFAAALTLPSAAAQAMLDEFAAFNTYFPHLDHTELAIAKDDATIVVRKDHSLQQATIDNQPVEDILKALGEKLGMELTPKDFGSMVLQGDFTPDVGLACLKSLMFAIPAGSANAEMLAQQATAVAGEPGKKYIDTSLETFALQEQIDAQRQRDDAQLLLTDLQSQVAALEEQLTQVQGLIATRAQISSSVEKYKYLLDKDVDRDSVKFRDDLAQIRHEQLQESAAGDLPPLFRAGGRDLKLPKQANYLVVAALLTVALGAIFSFAFKQYVFLTIGLIAGVLQLGCWYLLNQISPAALFNLRIAAKSGKLQSPAARIAGQIMQKLAFLEKFFIDKAWLSAIRAEVGNISSQISSRLSGADYESLIVAKRTLQQSVAAVTAALRANAKQDISPEDYLQKRRQLDMLKVEKMRLEGDLRDLPKFSELLDLAAAGRSANEPELALPTGLIAGVTAVKLAEQEDLKFKVGEVWQAKELAPAELLGLLTFIRLQVWSRAPELPLLLVNAVGSLPGAVQKLLQDYMKSLSEQGQIVNLKLT